MPSMARSEPGAPTAGYLAYFSLVNHACRSIATSNNRLYFYHSPTIMALSLPRRPLFRSGLYNQSKSTYPCTNERDYSYLFRPTPLAPHHLLPSSLPTSHHLPPHPQPLQTEDRTNPRPRRPLHPPQRKRKPKPNLARTPQNRRSRPRLCLRRPQRIQLSHLRNPRARPLRHGRRPRPHPHRPQTLATQNGSPRHPRPWPPLQDRKNPPHRTPASC